MTPTATHPRRLARSTGVSLLVLAALVGALLVAATPRATAAPAPDHYTPRDGATFNKPVGTHRQQYRIFRHLNRTINSARGKIRIAVFSFSDMHTAENLIRAHRRGVDVKLVFDDHHVFPAQRRLQQVLGSDPSRRSFAMFCEKSCRSTGGEMHAKFFQFKRAGDARKITMVGSNNMTSHNAERQWSDLVTIADDRDVYRIFVRWFRQLKRDQPRERPRIAAQHGENLILITPNNDDAVDGDPALNALAPVSCLDPVYETDPETGETVLDPATGEPVVRRNRRTKVYISQHAWFGPRGHAIARRVRDLADEGCNVKVYYAEGRLGSELKQMLEETPARLRTSPYKRVSTHQKLLIVRGVYGANKDANFVWTGSHNWTPWALRIDDIILRSANLDIVKRYTRSFNRLWRRHGVVRETPDEEPAPRG